MTDLSLWRNIGISAHIDSGKTTLSERILYYSGRTHKIGEVHEGGAVMDHMELEQERGITITSAATTVFWKNHTVNLIDTPGHVDFTVEVERSLRILDGAVLVLCSVGGVQAQSITIDRQMKRYGIPRIALINKMDRTGANPEKVIRQLKEKLDCDGILMQIPIGKESDFQGVVDLVTGQAVYFEGSQGEHVVYKEIPENLVEEYKSARRKMLEALAMYSDDLLEALLAEQEISEDIIYQVVRKATLARLVTPVFLASAYKNKGVQLLLDAVCHYLPSPCDRIEKAMRITQATLDARESDDSENSTDSENDSESDSVVSSDTVADDEISVAIPEDDSDDSSDKIVLRSDPNLSLVAMAFKTVDDPYGTLTFMRIYQGTITKGNTYYNQRTGKKERVSRIFRMHANQRMELDAVSAGDIAAVIGIDSSSGDTYADRPNYCTLESIFVPDPVIQIAIKTKNNQDADKLSKALYRFRKEDPTLSVTTDSESNQTLIAGMGELHLDIYIQRILREYKVEVETSAPKVNYREAPTKTISFKMLHRKQSGGSGQFADIRGTMGPIPDDERENEGQAFLFEEKIVGGVIPGKYIPAIDKGIRGVIGKGPTAGYPIVNLKVLINDGSYHEVDSSELAFRICAQSAIRTYFPTTDPKILEPIMKIEIDCPTEFQGNVTGDFTSRRGMITLAENDGPACRLEGEIPLAEMFGYSTILRGLTRGQGTFSMVFYTYRRVPVAIQEKIVKEAKEAGK